LIRFSVYENVAFKLHEQGVPEEEVESRCAGCCAFVNLEEGHRQDALRAFRGMRRRVGIAARWWVIPKIVLFDEGPPRVWNRDGTHDLRVGYEAARSGKTSRSIFVTHEMNNPITLLRNTRW